MEKHKICPSCNTKNPPDLFECRNCEADLTGVKITDAETEHGVTDNEGARDTASAKMVRICDCGTKNPANARKCSSCKEDISDILPTSDDEVQRSTVCAFMLSSLDGKYVYAIAEDDILIGRALVMGEYLCTKSYVSRTHARITSVNGELFVENLSNTNFTYVNNRRITEKTKLCDGDELALGGTNIDGNCQELAAYFLVRIGSCM